MSTLFISHSSRDGAAALALQAELEKQGHRSVFLDLDPEKGIQAGVSWERTLYAKLRACRAVVALCSDAYLASQWCFAEVALARMEGKELFVLQIDPWSEGTQMPSILTEEQFIDLRANAEQGYRRLFNGFKVKGIAPEEHREWGPDDPPYPGLRAFDETDAPIFFGRGDEVREGLELLSRAQRQGDPRLVTVLGSSGSGKSSLARAGLVPQLRRDNRWLVVGPFLPGGQPARALAGALAQAFDRAGEARPRDGVLRRLSDVPAQAPPGPGETGADHGAADPARERMLEALRLLKRELTDADAEVARSVQRLEELLSSTSVAGRPSAGPAAGSGGPLAELARELLLLHGTPAGNVLLVIDQFEELLGHDSEDPNHPANAFLWRLREALDAEGSPLLALVTMRSDYLGSLQRAPALRGLGFKSLSVGPMSTEGMRQVIERPAKLGQLELEDGLADLLLHDTGTPDALPLMAFTLRAMWDRFRDDRLLEIREYREFGGLQGGIAQVADETLEAAVAAGSENELRDAFLSLARPAAEGVGWSRQPVQWDGLAEGVQPMLQRFVDQRLLVKRADGTVVVAHEALFRSWKKLRRWLDENAEGLHLRREIQADAARWAEAPEAEQEPYLWRGGRLAHAVELRRAGILPLEELDRSFLEASDHAEHARAEAEEARRNKELRRARTFAAVVGAAFVVALVGGLLAYRANVAAQLAKTKADGLTRVYVATSFLDEDPTLAASVFLDLGEGVDHPTAWPVIAEVLTFHPLSTRVLRHSGIGWVAWAALGPDGGRVVTASGYGKTRVWPADGRAQPVDVPTGYDYFVNSWQLSPDGTRLVTACADGTAQIWPADGSSGPVVVLAGHESDVYVNSAAFSSDGERVVTASDDGTVRVWLADDRDSPAVVLLDNGSENGVVSAAFNLRGDRVVAGCDNGEVRVLPVSGSGEPVNLFGHDARVHSAEFSRDGKRVVTASADGTARVWPADGSSAPVVLPETESERDPLLSAAFSPDGSRVVTVSESGEARVWPSDGSGQPPVLELAWDEVEDYAPAEEEAPEEGFRVVSAVFSPDGERVVTASEDGKARIWRVDDWSVSRPVVLTGHTAALYMAAFSPDGTRVVTASEDETARVWTPDASGLPVVVLTGHDEDEYVVSAAFSPDGTRVVTASYDGTARLWAADGQGEPVVLAEHEGWVDSAEFGPDGSRVLTVSNDGKARLWDVDASARPIVVVPGEDPGQDAGQDGGFKVNAAELSPDGSRLVTACTDGTTRVWTVDGGGPPVLTLAGVVEGVEVQSAAFSPDGKRVLSVSEDGTVRVSDAKGGGAPVEITEQEDRIVSAAFSPDGARVVTAAEFGTVRVWPTNGGGPPVKLDGHWARVHAAAFSSDGTRVVTASADQTAQVWPADGAKPPVELIGMGESGKVLSAEFSSDGTRVVTVSGDGAARVWAADGSGRPIVLAGDTGEVLSAAFSPDGTRVVTTYKDGTARVWAVSGPALLEALRAASPACLTPAFRERYLGESTEEAEANYAECMGNR